MKVAKIKPVVNREPMSCHTMQNCRSCSEIEYHPYVMTHIEPVIELHAQYKIVTQAFASLAPTTRHPTGGPLAPVLKRLAEKLSSETGIEVDSSGVLLLWVMTKGGVCVTSSSDSARIQKMADLDRVRDLSQEELIEIEEAGRKVHFRQWVSLR